MHLPDMQHPPPPGGACECRLTYHDGTRRLVYCVDREEPYPDGRLIVSRTNLAGIITHANEAFVKMSGYELGELIGMPHCILRHPEMPRAAFADLWTTIASGKKWHGYVKNLRKDGLFYWVYATVIPNVRQGVIVSYTSVRRKPSRNKINEMSDLYAKMLSQERAAQ